MTKRVAPLVALALVVAACGGDDDDSADDSADDTTEDTTADTDADDDMTDDTAADDDMTDDTAADDDMTDETTPEPAAEIATDVGVDDTTIQIGLLADLTSIFAPTVVPITNGTEAYFERLNENGGIAGRSVEVEAQDTSYDVQKHQQLYDTFSSTGDQGKAFIGFSTGSPHSASIREDLVADGMGAIPLSWNSSWAVESGSNLFEWGTPYCVEAMNGVSWLAEEYGAQTVAILSFPGDYGEDGAIGAKYAADQLGLEVVYDGQAQVIPGADQTPVITALVESDADIVFATVASTFLAEIMAGAVAAGFDGQWAGNGPSYAPQLMGTEVAPVLDQYYHHLSPYPGFNGVDAPGMDDIVSLMREYRPDAVFQGTYVISWIQGEMLRQGLEAAAAAGDMTRQGIVDAMGSITFDMQGVIPDFSYDGDPNDIISRSTFVYDIDAAAYSADATVMDDVGDGTVLVDPAYTSEAAAGWDYAPCFAL